MNCIKTLDKICEGIIKVLRIILIVAMVIMTIVTFANIISRYCFSYALNWTDEMARYLMIIYVFFAGAIATYEDTHIAIEIVPNFFAKKIKNFDYQIIIGILIIISMCWFLKFSWSYVMAATKTMLTSPQLKIPMYILQSITIVSPILCVFFAAVNVLRRILKMIEKNEKEEA